MTAHLSVYITAAGDNSVDLNEDETLSFREGDLMGWYGNILMIYFLFNYYCKFGNFREGFIFAKLRFMRSFVKIRSLRNLL